MRAALATAAIAGGLSLEQSSEVIVHVKYTVVVRLTLDRVNWLEVLGIVLAIIINFHIMKLIAKLR